MRRFARFCPASIAVLFLFSVAHGELSSPDLWTRGPNSEVRSKGPVRIGVTNPITITDEEAVSNSYVLTSDADGKVTLKPPPAGTIGSGTAAGQPYYWNGVAAVTAGGTAIVASSEQLSTALADANVGKISILKGSYNISSTIDLAARGGSIVLEGAGPNVTILNWTGGAEPMVNASGLTSGPITIRDLSLVGAEPAEKIPGQYGIYFDHAADVLNIINVEVLSQGDDAIFDTGEHATVNIKDCSIRRNFHGYAINISPAPGGHVEDLNITGNSLYNNYGGIYVGDSYRAAVTDNDIEAGAPALPLMNIQGGNVILRGNSIGLYAAATAPEAVLVSGDNVSIFGGIIVIGADTQTAVRVSSTADKFSAYSVGFSAPGAGGGVGVQIDSGATNTSIINCRYSNSFTTNYTDAGTNSMIWDASHLASTSSIMLTGKNSSDSVRIGDFTDTSKFYGLQIQGADDGISGGVQIFPRSNVIDLAAYMKYGSAGVMGSSGIKFYTNGSSTSTTQLTSTGLGLGTLTPSAKLHVLGDILKSSATTNTGGGVRRSLAEGTATLSGASTVITLTPVAGGSRIPAGARLAAVQLRVDTLVTSGDGATSWSAAFSGGSATSLATGQAFTKNTKIDVMLAGTEITSGLTDITITPNSGTFSAGAVRAIVYYDDLVALSSNP